MIYVTFGGSVVEREEIAIVAQQVMECLRQLEQPYEVFDLYKWSAPEFISRASVDDIFLILDPYFQSEGKNFDVRSFLENAELLYTGPSQKHSAVTSDKQMSKAVVASPTIRNIPDKLCVSISEIREFVDHQKLSAIIVKPLNRGGGEDVVLLKAPLDLDGEIERLLERHGALLVEQYIQGREISCPVMKMGDEVRVFPLVHLAINGFEIFNATAKATAGSLTQIIPADVEAVQEAAITDFAIEFYEAIKFRGLLRIDFIATDSGTYFLEANGYPSLGRNFGISVPSAATVGVKQADIIQAMIEEARWG
jgi:D-alanine-D-alanine ligase